MPFSDIGEDWSEIMEIPLCQRRETKGGKIDNIPIVGARQSHTFDESANTEADRMQTTIKIQIRALTQKEQERKNARIRFVKNLIKKGAAACGYQALINLSPKELNTIAKVVGLDEREVLGVDP